LQRTVMDILSHIDDDYWADFACSKGPQARRWCPECRGPGRGTNNSSVCYGAMPKYFFDIHDGAHSGHDENGQELASPEEAKQEALRFGIGTALPLLAIGMMSREALGRWRERLLAAGSGGKVLMGVMLVAIGSFILTGFDKRIETILVEVSPAWLTELTTRF
jgi:hypothetical protein